MSLDARICKIENARMEKNIPTNALTVGVAEAARLLGITPRFLFMLIKRNEIPSLRIGTRRLIRVGALRDFIEAREKASQ